MGFGAENGLHEGFMTQMNTYKVGDIVEFKVNGRHWGRGPITQVRSKIDAYDLWVNDIEGVYKNRSEVCIFYSELIQEKFTVENWCID